MLSIMCNRIILSGFSLSRRTNAITTFEDAIELTFATRSRYTEQEWSIELDELDESLDQEQLGYSLSDAVKHLGSDDLRWGVSFVLYCSRALVIEA